MQCDWFICDHGDHPCEHVRGDRHDGHRGDRRHGGHHDHRGGHRDGYDEK